MDITQIETIISQISSSYGYSPIIASEAKVEGAIESLPAAWIQLPKILYVEGREQGIVGHSITLKLIDNLKAISTEDQNERFSKMQADALEIFTSLSAADGIVEVNGLTITPCLIPTTRHDNVSQLCQATVVSYF